MSEMFCFQCQQTAGGSGCVKTGVCGKQPETAHLQDALVCRLIRLAEVCRTRQEYPPEVTRLLADGLFPQRAWGEQKPHLSARLCAELAQQAGAKRLVITHLNPDYDPATLLKEAREVLPTAELAQLGRTYRL